MLDRTESEVELNVLTRLDAEIADLAQQEKEINYLKFHAGITGIRTIVAENFPTAVAVDFVDADEYALTKKLTVCSISDADGAELWDCESEPLRSRLGIYSVHMEHGLDELDPVTEPGAALPVHRLVIDRPAT